jgi:hypothetical protein
MDVFISWSGAKSKKVGEILRDWLPAVIQAVTPYFTPDDVAKGAKWSTEISKQLEACRVGILCITPDNFGAPWLLFEAGALSKNLDKSRVCPILFGLEPADVTGPLVQFQFTQFTKEDFKRLISTINAELEEHKLADSTLQTVFETWWPKLEGQVREQLARPVKSKGDAAKRSDRDLLEEVLSLARTTAEESRQPPIQTGAISALMRNYTELVYRASKLEEKGALLGPLRAVLDPLEYIVQSTMRTRRETMLIQEVNHMLTSFEPQRKRRAVRSTRPKPVVEASSEIEEESNS